MTTATEISDRQTDELCRPHQSRPVPATAAGELLRDYRDARCVLRVRVGGLVRPVEIPANVGVDYLRRPCLAGVAVVGTWYPQTRTLVIGD